MLLLLAAVGSIYAADKVENLMSVSVGDLYSTGRGDERVDSPEAIKRALSTWSRNYECPIVLWRLTDYMFDDYVPNPRDKYIMWCWKKEQTMRETFDPTATAQKISKDLGLKFYLNISFNDHGWPEEIDGCKVHWYWQDKMTINNPEYQDKDKDGNYQYGYLDLANPKARKAMIDKIIYYMDKYQADGVYLNSRSHSNLYFKQKKYKPGLMHADRFGFSDALVAEYKKRYGINITDDPRFDYRHPEYAPKSVEVANWRRLRGEYYEIFYKEVKQALGSRTLLLSLPAGNYMGSSGGNIYVDHDKIIREKMADGIVFGTASGFVPKGSQRKLGFCSSEASDDNYNVPTFAEYLDKYGEKNVAAGIKLWSRDNDYDREEARLIARDPRWNGIMCTVLTLSAQPYILDHPSLRPAKGVLAIEGWFLTKGEGRLVSKYSHSSKNAGRGWEMYLGREKKSNEHYLYLRCNLRYPNGRQRDSLLKSKNPVPMNKWNLLTGVYDAEKSEMRVYINGREEGLLKLEPHTALNSNLNVKMAIGSYGGANVSVIDGLIDSVRISSQAPDYSKGIVEYDGNEAGTILYCRFNNAMELLKAPADMKKDCIGELRFAPGRQGRQAVDFSSTGK